MKRFYNDYSIAHTKAVLTLVAVGFTVLVPPANAVDTPYMAECRAQGVPIPPDWAETGTAWELQGNLRTGSNLLKPGEDAFVWTYADPAVKGACIALPRGSGGAGSLAGIICQSATTGAACFWDNRKRNNANPMRQVPQTLGWKGKTLIISELKDATNLTEPGSGICPTCHRGNNVFLISPDDPTWEKVLRGPLVTSPGSTFTTRVEASSDNQGGRPRYVPITSVAGQPPRPRWGNDFAAGGCDGCHENPTFPFTSSSLTALTTMNMPPVCAAGGVENCYGHPIGLEWLPSVLDLVLN